jgi:hypothetical protein
MYPGHPFTFSGALADDLARYRAIPASKREKISLIAGHSPRVTGIPDIDQLPIITFLRDPVARVRSFCQHVSEGRDRYWEEMFPPGTFDLDRFLDSGNLGLSNLQAKMLLGDRGYGPLAGDADALVDEVLQILRKKVTCFGIVEEFDASLVWFRRRLGWEKWPVYRTLNVGKGEKRIEFRSDQLDKVRALNAIDIQLYERAVELFQEQTGALADDLQADLVEFRSHQQDWEEYLALCASSFGRRLTMDWTRRFKRGMQVLRTEGWDGLRYEVTQLLRWLRAKDRPAAGVCISGKKEEDR